MDIRDAEIGAFFVAAMPNPERRDTGNEWVSIANLTEAEVSLEGWALSDTRRKPKPLSGKLPPRQSIAVSDVRPAVSANSGGAIVLSNALGQRVGRIMYRKVNVREGKPVVFVDRRRA